MIKASSPSMIDLHTLDEVSVAAKNRAESPVQRVRLGWALGVRRYRG